MALMVEAFSDPSRLRWVRVVEQEQGVADRDPITYPRARRKQAVSETKHLNQYVVIGYAAAKVP
jgi:hypothetical protein